MATSNTQDLKGKFGRFRVLIMGRANAGKTTILRKVCGTTDHPEIYDTKGNKLDVAMVTSSIKRGNHNIANEMVFKSNPGFVFHDSCGFEAGSEDEFESMKKFISEHANATKLEDRIHAIWYCIPMDDHWRAFQRSEEKFFRECDTGRIPVVVVFTKFEALRPVAFGEIKKDVKGLSSEERSKRIAQRVEEIFTKTSVLDRLYDPENRAHPKSHVRLDNMNKPDTNCNILLEHTALALDDEALQFCLISTQRSNLDLCIKCAIESLVDRANAHSPFDYQLDQLDIAKWFPQLHLSYWKYYEEESSWESWESWKKWWSSKKYEHNEEVPDFNRNIFKEGMIFKDALIDILQPLAAKGSGFTATNRIIHTGMATVIVLEYYAFHLPHKSVRERLRSAVAYYLQSPTAVAVEQGAKEISSQGYKKEELTKKIFQFILEHRMSKELTSK